jgi:hypothetical protein
MALYVRTNTPKKLLRLIREAIAQDEAKGRINTWATTNDGGFVHNTKSDQWEDEATLYPSVVPDHALIFAIKGPADKDLTRRAYAVYSGHFAEMLLAHFDQHFESIDITALGESVLGDDF